MQLNATSILYATATAFGGMKFAEFKKFLDSFELRKRNAQETLEEMKKTGLPIEEI